MIIRQVHRKDEAWIGLGMDSKLYVWNYTEAKWELLQKG